VLTPAPRPPDAERAAPVRRETPTRVGILLDFDALSRQAQEQGGELSFRKLLRGIAGDRPVIRATCYLGKTTPNTARQALAASGFTVQVCDDDDATAQAIGVEALALAARVDALVLAPATRVLPAVLQDLDRAGVRLEAAGFDGLAPAGVASRRLGRDCIFVP
jgi:hypothetical protein